MKSIANILGIDYSDVGTGRLRIDGHLYLYGKLLQVAIAVAIL